ncbi:hypothetical protein, unlikely [Trypanosoma brucei gambiense DAL972]|uniref:Uncharacterized protein n=1 Tax=Trypanosoma brucei gambiense (strain MHOM/CI/86/DAL972) TaxID=679716 RepID=D0A4Q7_TRYB9|nr:hypothetical protein, unlikely [Trypanosoma brucei gambiense DAL972]CBH16251.1 hypothetical protein, unlikely [Trypanosoma brucei gambiense DAL972]|eukprot:XP_011778515.1 hypothetical protein, unlikely [Trypanosoma brucei gambiense DAL972]
MWFECTAYYWPPPSVCLAPYFFSLCYFLSLSPLVIPFARVLISKDQASTVVLFVLTTSLRFRHSVRIVSFLFCAKKLLLPLRRCSRGATEQPIYAIDTEGDEPKDTKYPVGKKPTIRCV